MDFRELVYITTVAEQKSITKAANELYIAQPSLSHYVQKVEEEMGVKLFDRSTSPISLTYAGEKYIETARQILMLNSNLKRQFRDIAEGKKGRIKIGLPRERASYMLPLIFPKFRTKYPGIEVNIFEARSSILIDSVIKGQTDFVILPFDIKNKLLETEYIYEEELVLIANEKIIKESNCIVNENKQIEMSTVHDMPFILLKKGHGIRNVVDTVFNNWKIKPNIILEISSNQTACKLAGEGIGAAIVPQMTVNLVSNINRKDIYSLPDPKNTWEVVAAYRKDGYMGKIEKDFLEIARQALKNNSI
jgi:DNA-binding transcriptional LysR family regulator